MSISKIMIEGSYVVVEKKDWKSWHGITLCCAILNEEEKLNDFIEWHKPYVDNIVVVDGGSVDSSFNIASRHTGNLKIIKFAGHYGNQKNRAIELSQNDWILFLDPDERLSKDILVNIKNLINQEEFDCYSFPRMNYVDGVEDKTHGLDYQDRLFRSYCRYVRPTHEELVGFKNKKNLQGVEFSIKHEKAIARHVSRNSNYILFDYLNMREMGSPGSQAEDSFYEKYKDLR